MRTANSSTIRYTPGDVPADAAALPRFLMDELTRLRDVISAIADGQLDTTSVAPTKPRKGMIRYADGTNWNPGSGEGLYLYKANPYPNQATSDWYLLG